LLPALRRSIAQHLELDPFAQEWTSAVALSFVNRAWFRVGSERHARRSRTYGVTTLLKRHATVRGNRVTFRFRGKQRALVRSTVVDAELADAVEALFDYPRGARLFRFDREGEPAPLTGPILNAYVDEYLGPEFTTKDFRTWGGTLTAAIAFAQHGPPKSASDERPILAAVMRRVGQELGNTPAVARTSYVSPAVVEQWRDGRLLEGDIATRPLSVLRGRGLALLPEEKALLTLLRSWRIRRALAA
jgi:DNA topoisomerase I